LQLLDLVGCLTHDQVCHASLQATDSLGKYNFSASSIRAQAVCLFPGQRITMQTFLQIDIKPVQCCRNETADRDQVLARLGGRTRIRTLDPLIKSQFFIAEITMAWM
jgi:hypothetical protein